MYETRNQSWDEKWKIHKYLEIKQLSTEQPLGQRRNQKEIKTKIMGCNESSSKTGGHSNKSI